MVKVAKTIKNKRIKLTMETRHKLEGLVFISPFIMGVIMFFAFPLYMSLKLSFGKITKIAGFKVQWKGLENYTRAFFVDVDFIPTFLQTIQNTLVEIPLIIIMSLLIAIMMNKNIRFRGFFRVVFFIPFLLGTGEVMRQLLNQGVDRQVLSLSQSKIIPYEVLEYFGAQIVRLIDTFFSVIVQVLWKSGVQILLFLAGLQSIPVSLYESAKVDSATEWEILWKVTLPMISPIMLLNIIYTIVDSFVNIRNPLLSYIQNFAFKRGQFEYAAAMGWIYFAFIILIILLVIFIMRRYIYTTVESGKERKKR